MKILSIYKISLNVGIALYFSSFSNANLSPTELPTFSPTFSPPVSCPDIGTETELDFENATATSTLGEVEDGELRFQNIGHHREGDNNILLDLVVRQVPDTIYIAPNLNNNGKKDYYGKINIESENGEGTFDFCFENPETQEKITLEAFFFSFYDMDGTNKGRGMEVISMENDAFTEYYLTDDTEISQSVNGGLVEFTATTPGKGVRHDSRVF